MLFGKNVSAFKAPVYFIIETVGMLSWCHPDMNLKLIVVVWIFFSSVQTLVH